ncbi:hypothetical protein MAC_09834 [Metarhizium acridum CQMa 102]|uniref:Uncharacterized protein n=1 Tax=Metarhizium acridum (strain CQMa 102) TaxID=655827 RepID=E9EIY6_METAQ|nr:uncharacterized protein MAC_09834 [Metarhizium acridum CQMa 102]EFY84123.1 hypothetical protein MAC_09834 [Metarhizium acridum CQMa 102]
MANFGPPVYLLSDGQYCRNLLGNPVHQAMYLYARSQPNLESPQANFFLSELQADFRLEDGYSVGAEFNTAARPGREGTYSRTDRVVWRVDTEHLTLTADVVLEAKAPERMSDREHFKQVLDDAEEIVRTHQYERLHVITTRSTTFHTWLYTAGVHRLESLFPEELYGQHLDVSVPQASEEWFRFVCSVKTKPNKLKIHPSQVLQSQTTSATAGPSSLAFPETATSQVWPESTVEERTIDYGEPSQPELGSQGAIRMDDNQDTSQNVPQQFQAQTAAGASGPGHGSDTPFIDVTNNIRRVRHRMARDELIFINSHGNQVVTVEDDWKRRPNLGRHARV